MFVRSSFVGFASLSLVFASAHAGRMSFEYRAGDTVIGTESITLTTTEGQVVARGQAEATLGSAAISAKLHTVYAAGSLEWVSYTQTFEASTPQGDQAGTITATNSDGKASIHIDAGGAKLDKSFEAADHPFILDQRFLHHYAAFFQRLGAEGWFAAPEPRSFSSIVPSSLTTMSGSLDADVSSAVAVLDGDEIGVIMFRMTMGGVPSTITVTDETFDLLLADITAQNIQIVRVGYEPPVPPADAWYDRFTDTVVEETGAFRSGDIDIPFSLTLPAGDKDGLLGIVLVHGSGPNDRDGTVGRNKPLKDIAFELAAKGAAVLRYDKRTHVAPSSLDAEALTLETVVMADAREAVAALRSHERVDEKKIAVVGHSLGGRVAPVIADAVDASHVVVLAGSAVSIVDTIERQLQFLADTKGLDDEATANEKQAATELVAPLRDRASDPLTPVLGAPAAYWWDIEDTDPVEALVSFDGPALILRGDRDYQIVEADTERWRAAVDQRDNDADVVYDVPGSNHIFIRTRGEISAGDVYAEGHVDELVIEKMTEFLGLKSKKKKRRR